MNERGPSKTYLSIDDISDEHSVTMYPIEFLNRIGIGNYPPHELTIKPGTPLMVLRNLNVSAGLCNGTILEVLRMERNVIEC